MAMIDDITQQLTDMGFNMGGGFGAIGGFGAPDISQILGQQYGLTQDQLPSSMFQPISESLLKGVMPGTYSPQIKVASQPLIDEMLSKYNIEGKKAFGGFAGSGQQTEFAGGVKDVYGKGMTDVLTNTSQQRAQSLKAIQDMINQWHSQASQIRYG